MLGFINIVVVIFVSVFKVIIVNFFLLGILWVVLIKCWEVKEGWVWLF